MPTLLVLDPVDGEALRVLLMGHGHSVQVADTVAEALECMRQLMPDLVVLDTATEPSGLLLLPKLDGTPAIVCSREQTVRDRVACLRMGADDFVGKPYDSWELIERINAVLRRSQAKPTKYEQIVIGALTIDDVRIRVSVDGHIIGLTPTEYKLVLLLATRAEQTLSFAEMGQAIWETSYGITHTLAVHIDRIRHKFRHAGMTNPLILSVRTVGYCLTLKEAFSKGEPL